MKTPDPVIARLRAVSTSDIIASLAFMVSAMAFGWQINDALKGPELSLLNISGRTVEFRCVASRETCWASLTEEKRAARISVIAPVFAANRGAENQNEVIERISLGLTLGQGAQARVLDHSAIAYWQGTSGGGRGDLMPFEPMFVPGRGVEGAEMRFTAIDVDSRLLWREFVEGVISGDIVSLELVLTVQALIEPEPRSVSCTAAISEHARLSLTRRQSENGKPYLTLVCE